MKHGIIESANAPPADAVGTAGLGFRSGESLYRQEGIFGYRSTKRFLDVVISSILIFFFSPIFVLVALTLKAGYGGPILFRHERVGRNGVAFRCLKFRTMHKDSDRILAECLESDSDLRQEWTRTQKLRRDPRIHGLGFILRKSSMDELPQLFNVVRGEMSIVGPRPIIREEAENYGSDLGSYLALRPGITGLWQVSGRNNTTYSERVACDVKYFEQRSFRTDLGILLRTVMVVISSDGAY